MLLGTPARRGLGASTRDAMIETVLGVEPDYIKNQMALVRNLLIASTAASLGTLLFILLRGR